MPRTKRTITRDSVFRSTTPATATPDQGVEIIETPTRQTGVWLTDEELEWLDNRCSDIKRGGWRGITRSAVIRALIHALMDKPFSLAGVSGEVELIDTLKRTLNQ